MPSLKSLRALCDKMKNLSSTITICSISTGDLSFIVETDAAIIVSRYFNLKIDQISNNSCVDERQDNPNLEIGCCIDTKNLSTCFGSLQVSYTSFFIFGILLSYTSESASSVLEYVTSNTSFILVSICDFGMWHNTRKGV